MARFPAALGLAVAAALLLPAGDAAGARFTDALDDVESEVMARDGAIPSPTPKDQKQAKAAYGKALAALAGDATSLAEELKLASKVAKALKKVTAADPDLAEVLDDAIDRLLEEAGATLEDLAEDVDGEPDSKKKGKAEKAVDAATGLLELAGDALDAFQRLRYITSAIKKSFPAVKFVDGSGGGGGGGGDHACWFDSGPPAAGDAFSAPYDGSTFAFDGIAKQAQDTPGTQRRVAFYSCEPARVEMFAFFWFDPNPTTGVPLGIGTGLSVYASRGVADGGGFMQTSEGFGTITFTEVNATTGTYAATFTFTGGGVSVTSGSFRVTGLKP